jgi:predicted RNA binding protein YcfA (HicA-like mRNA interferase family)
MGILIERDSRRLLALLLASSFVVHSVRGSHHKLRKADRTVILPHPRKDLPLGTARAIDRQAGLLQED